MSAFWYVGNSQIIYVLMMYYLRCGYFDRAFFELAFVHDCFSKFSFPTERATCDPEYLTFVYLQTNTFETGSSFFAFTPDIFQYKHVLSISGIECVFRF